MLFEIFVYPTLSFDVTFGVTRSFNKNHVRFYNWTSKRFKLLRQQGLDLK
jgi:hypothetical protein